MLRSLVLVVLVSLMVVAPALATDYYVDKDGVETGSCNDGNSGAKNSPVCSCTAGTALLSSGDRLYLRGGYYQGGAPHYCYWYANTSAGYPPEIPSGSSWASATTIAAYPGETVTIEGGGFSLGSGVQPAERYIIFDRLHLENGFLTFESTDHTEDDGTEWCWPGPNTVHHIRFQNGSIYQTQNWTGGGIMIGGCGDHIELLNNDFYNAGGGTAGQNCSDPYGCYTAYINFKDSIIDGNRIYDNAGYGLHLFSSDLRPQPGHVTIRGNVVSNNAFWNNGFWDLRTEPDYYGGGWAMVCCSGPQNKVYNNLIFGNWSGIQIDYACDDCEVYNNTSFANEVHGISTYASARVQVWNNIAVYNGNTDINNESGATLVGNWRTTDGDPGFVNGIGKPCFGHSCHFDNARSADFHLRADSPARNTKSCLTGFNNPLPGAPSITTDFRNLGWGSPGSNPGIGRPQPSGGLCEPGAYEYQEGAPPTCPPDCPTDESPTVAAIYVDSNGPGHGTTPSDSYGCRTAETLTTPKATMASALECMTVPGKTMQLRGGTHVGFVNTGTTPITGGPNWSTPTRIEPYGSETPVIQLPVNNPGAVMTFNTGSYIEVRGPMTLDGMNRSYTDGITVYAGADHLRFTGLTLVNNDFANVDLIGGSDIEVSENILNGTGCDFSVVLYEATSNVVVNHNTITSGDFAGVAADPSGVPTSLSVTRNSITGTGTGVDIGSGSGAVVKNNLIRAQSGDGIRVRAGAQGTKVFHNDTVSNAGTGILCDSGAGTTTGIELKNNITVANTTAQFVIAAGCAMAPSGDQGNIKTGGTGTAAGDLAALFTNAPGGDYTLKTTAPASPAIGAAVLLTSVTEDIDGNVRPFPANGLPDAGAYESQSIPVAEATTTASVKVMGMFF
jgi:Right handed beta helix region